MARRRFIRSAKLTRFTPCQNSGNAADFDLRLPVSHHTQTLRLSVAGEVFYEKRLSPTFWTRLHDRPPVTPNAVVKSASYRHVTIIIPVYNNLAVTRVCPQSVLASHPDNANIDILIVNDAAPERAFMQYLRPYAKNTRVQLLENQQNLGFVASVNCALSVIDDGDVVLLNSDTVVPPDFVKRLAAASGPAIGTVTPLSNNGEYVSFPKPNQSNPLEFAEALLAIDAMAAHVNAGRVVEIPSGIGFCLYITRDCLDVVGLLSEDFHRGYLEDIDFCLRARQHGFKSVSAGSVYVGHVGAVSFGSTKRTLVTQNDKILRARYPKFWQEFLRRSFWLILSVTFAPILVPIVAYRKKHRILVSGSTMSMAIAKRRAQLLRDAGQDVLILDISFRNGSREARIIDPAGASPNLLSFRVADQDGDDALIDYLRAINPSSFELINLDYLSRAVLNLLLSISSSYDMLVADFDDAMRGSSIQRTSNMLWLKAATSAHHIIAPSPQAYAFAHHLVGDSRLRFVTEPPTSQRFKQRNKRSSCLGLIPASGPR